MNADDPNNGMREPTAIPVHPAFAITLNALQDIANERGRQMKDEGYTREHDDSHKNGELAAAAVCYAMSAANTLGDAGLTIRTRAPGWWPWSDIFWKPKEPRQDLIRAAALIVAEIERLDRMKQ